MKDKSLLEIKYYLEKKFSNISFEPEEHRYFNEEKEEYQSVSSFLEQYLSPFDSDTVSKRISKREKVPQNEIKTQWSVRRDFSIVKGTEFHLYVETFLKENRKIKTITPIEKEIRLFHEFWDQRNEFKYEIVATELIVFSDAYKIAGTIDCLVRHNRTKNFFIMDWKTNKNLRVKSPYFIKMKPPLGHLDDCDINKYSLQMGLYSKILSQNSEVNVEGCFIIHFSRENQRYKIFKTIDFSREIDSLLTKKKTMLEMK